MKRGMAGHVSAQSSQVRLKNDDIVCSLPLELLLNVIEYLDPADVVRNRRVRIIARALLS